LGVSSSTSDSGEDKKGEGIGDVRAQLSKYGQQLNSYLRQINANVETYKFSVEKSPEGISVVFSLKATIKGKE
jgi:hypothetical protein